MTNDNSRVLISIELPLQALRIYRRGGISADELVDITVRDGISAGVNQPGCVATFAQLRLKLAELGGFYGEDSTLGLPDVTAVTLGDRLAIAVASGVQRGCNGLNAWEDWASTKRRWAAEVQDFIASSRPERRGLLLSEAIGVWPGLSTEFLADALAESDRLPERLPLRYQLATHLIDRWIRTGEVGRALAVASGFSPDPHRLLLLVANSLNSTSEDWPPQLFALIRAHRDRIAADNDVAQLVCAAAVAAIHDSDWALELLSLANIESRAQELINNPDIDEVLGPSRAVVNAVEMFALAALTYHAAGDRESALRCAHVSDLLPSDYRIPKAAGWVLSTADTNPHDRVLHLRRAYCKYDHLGALEGRMAHDVATAYLELEQPEYAAYFLAQAISIASDWNLSFHFAPAANWSAARGLLNTTAVSQEELFHATDALRELGYLPKPELADRFHWIDEQWYVGPYSQPNPAAVQPKPVRVADPA